MTKKQKELKKRNRKILKLSKTLTIEEIAIQFDLSIPSVYKVVQWEKLRG